MKESRIELTERLRREGRWQEASRFKDEMVRNQRAEGMKRREAGEQAWQKMAEAYPPMSPEEVRRAEKERAIQKATALLDDTVRSSVEEWERKYGITLPEDARVGLMAYVETYFWPDPYDVDGYIDAHEK